MKLNRQGFLKSLSLLRPGLSSRENIEQSTCLVFRDGKISTFNDEVACIVKSPIKIEGAVKANPLLQLLEKMSEDDIDIDIGEEGSIRVKGKRKRATYPMETEVLSPLDVIETPEDWYEIPEGFEDAVRATGPCASRDESMFILTCIHIGKDFLEATDRYQIARYPIEIPFEEDGDVIIRAESLMKVVGFNMEEFALTESWIHFRSKSLQLSCRRFSEEYRDLSQYITDKGTEPLVLPGGLEEVIKRAEIFSSENVSDAGKNLRVKIGEGRILIEGHGASGKYEEMQKVKYSGDPIEFMIAPSLLVEVGSKSSSCRIGRDRLYVNTGKFRYVTSIIDPATVSKASDEDDE